MRKLILLLGVAILGSGGGINNELQAQGTIALRTGGLFAYHNDLVSALEQARDGDTLYLPNSQWSINENLIIDKKISIYGVGIHPNANTLAFTTAITTNNNAKVIFGGNANGTMVTGINFNLNIQIGQDNDLQPLVNLTVNRCRVGKNIEFKTRTGKVNPTTGFIVSESLIIGDIIGTKGIAPLAIVKNIIQGRVLNLTDAPLAIQNNIFLYDNPVQALFENCGAALVNNNIILSQYILSNDCQTFVFENNVLTYQLPANPKIRERNNLNQISLNNIFDSSVTQNFDNTYNTNANYALLATSPAKGKGKDATDPGIFGTASPAKAFFEPPQPVIYKRTSPKFPDANGKLKVNFTVKAQNN